MQSNRKLSLDYSQVELRVLAGLASKGAVTMDEEKTHFAKQFEARNKNVISQIYGVNRDELTKELPKEQVREMTLAFVRAFPVSFNYIPGLRKAKTKMMVNALIHGHADNGNHFVTCYSFEYHFFYRGTPIYRWNALKDIGQAIDAGKFEDTASTRNQRKEIMKAIENFKEAVFNL